MQEKKLCPNNPQGLVGHHFRIESSLIGTCKNCGMEKDFAKVEGIGWGNNSLFASQGNSFHPETLSEEKARIGTDESIGGRNIA